MKVLTVILCSILSVANLVRCQDYYFSDDFKFGAATAAYQVEGAWDADGKGESIWDRGTHDHPDKISDGSNGDIACDSYNKYKEDIQNLKQLGVHFYRFSISWPRILPNGKSDSLNQAGVDYYNNVINELIANDIEPYVTIFHWDLPQALQDELGGWTNRDIIDYYVDYARILFEQFGDRVKVWMTFNEILQICEAGYADGRFAPFVEQPGIGGYECTHTVLIAHGKAYRLYESDFKPSQNGQIGIAIDSYWHEPHEPDNESDQAAAEFCLIMNYGWFVNPILDRNYPAEMIERIEQVSQSEGFETSRLPVFSDDELDIVSGSFDFMGLNHYTSDMSFFAEEGAGDHPSHWADVGVNGVNYDTIVPWGLRRLLVWIKNKYNNPPMLITENGANEGSENEDYDRIEYHRQYLNELLNAINEDGCNVIGYTAWSYMDNFEWTSGYTVKFGLYHVDFNDDNRPRTPKKSASVYNNIIVTKHIDWDYNPTKIEFLSRKTNSTKKQ